MTGDVGNRDSSAPTILSFGPARFLNRELSWLDFADHLLELAEDPTVALLERVKFLAIYSTGIDEFFQVRVAGLKDRHEAGVRERSPDGRTPAEQLEELHLIVTQQLERQEKIFLTSVVPALAEAGIVLCSWDELDEAGRDELIGVFDRDIFPILTPLAVDPGHPFPYISNLSLNLGVLVTDPVTGTARFARLKVPPLLPRFVPLPDRERFVPLEQVIAANLAKLFPDMVIGSHEAFRVTRNADLILEEDEADDLLDLVEIELRRRRFGRAVRLEVDRAMDPTVREMLLRELELGPDDLYVTSSPLDLGELWGIATVDRPDLHEPPWTPLVPGPLALAAETPGGIFEVLRERDILVHHPYESFAASVEAFIFEAAADPDVLAIKQTLYRTSGDAPFVSALVAAAEAGKQVAALVEVKARFDEQRNIAWARQLEQAGVHVVYGVVGLKTHSKTALVVRREDDGIRRYCHVGTGNYNSDTARVYEDLGILSADPELGADLTDLFNQLTGFSRQTVFRKLVLAPYRYRSWILEQIATETEVGTEGRITIKVNGLTDAEVIDALYGASRAGVRVDLVVRGVCCLRPGVDGLSENITVRSIVGRFLEHSRIFRFGTPSEDVRAFSALSDAPGRHRGPRASHAARYFFGSADLMDRNLDRRIEALVPVTDPELCARLDDALTLDLADDVSAWRLGPDGSWSRIATVHGISVQRRLQELALERAKRRRAPEPPA